MADASLRKARMRACWPKTASTPSWRDCSSSPDGGAKEKALREARLSRHYMTTRGSDCEFDPGSLGALRALGDFELHTLAFLQTAEALRIDRREVDKHVLPTV